MKVREYSQNNRDFIDIDLKEYWKSETKHNPYLRGMSYEQYKRRYFKGIKLNRLKFKILKGDKKYKR